MNLQNILSEIEQKDPEIMDRLDTRRNAMKDFARVSGKVALASLPFALGTMFKKAYGSPTAPTDIIIDTLNFALTLEFLESYFYAQAVSSGTVPAAGDQAVGFTIIRNHEAAHVAFLQSAITAAGGTPVSFMATDFDYTAQGTFPGIFTSYPTILAVAQTFEDTGVRAYKGQAGNLITNNDVLTAALQIHSVEARHAAHIRALRNGLGVGYLIPSGTVVKPWITQAQSGIDAGASANMAIQQSYAGEDVVMQGSPAVTVTGIGGFTYIDANAASEAFDEPLTKEQVTTIITPFLVP